MSRIDLERSDLGATMSRMEHVINNLSNISKNTKEARSRIQDADIALEDNKSYEGPGSEPGSAGDVGAGEQNLTVNLELASKLNNKKMRTD